MKLFPQSFLEGFQQPFKSPKEEQVYGVLLDIFPDILHNVCFFRRELDFFVPSLRLNIEIDGFHHERKEQFDKDTLRDEILDEKGVKVIRINTEAINNIDEFRNQIAYALSN